MATKSEHMDDPQSCMNKAMANEPVFVLLGRDQSAPAAVREWVMSRLRTGRNSYGDQQTEEALAWADEVERLHTTKEGGK